MAAITYRLSGQLGNQLQLWACARTLSLRYGWDFIYRPLDCRPLLPGQRRRPIRELALVRRPRVPLTGHEWDRTGNETGDLDPAVIDDGALYVLDWSGIFKRVDEFRSQLVRELRPPTPAQKPPHVVAVHIRRGDTSYSLPISYYAAAVRASEADEAHVFTDGAIADVATRLQQAVPEVAVTGRSRAPAAPYDLVALASYRVLVLSMSWFSYWAAYLADGARIFAPAEFCYYPSWQPVQA